MPVERELPTPEARDLLAMTRDVADAELAPRLAAGKFDAGKGIAAHDRGENLADDHADGDKGRVEHVAPHVDGAQDGPVVGPFEGRAKRGQDVGEGGLVVLERGGDHEKEGVGHHRADDRQEGVEQETLHQRHVLIATKHRWVSLLVFDNPAL